VRGTVTDGAAVVLDTGREAGAVVTAGPAVGLGEAAATWVLVGAVVAGTGAAVVGTVLTWPPGVS
jgi:hypothetical protein